MNDKKTLYIVVAVLVAMNIATLFYLLGTNRFNGHMDFDMNKHMEEEYEEVKVAHSGVNYNKPVAETHKKTYDFGQILKSDGVVSTTFEIENHGKQNLVIGEISTSCGCTTAEVDKTTLGFNEETELTVYFDPDFHKEPQGKITRSVFVETNDPDLPEMQFDVFVEILD